MQRHTFVTTMRDAGVDLRDVQIAALKADLPHHDCVQEPIHKSYGPLLDRVQR